MAKVAEHELFDLIGRIYETATQESGDGWQEVFEELSRLLSSGPGSLHFYIKRSEHFATIADTNEPGFVDDFNKIYFPILPFRDILTSLKPGEVFDRTQELPDEMFVPTELYQDHFRNFGIYHVVHANLMDSDSALAGITFTRPESMREFEEIEMEAFQFILPHLQRAIQMHVKLIETDGRQKVFEEAWDRVPQGVLLAKESGVVIFRNEASENHFMPRGPLDVDHNGLLITPDNTETEELRAIIKSVFEPDLSAKTAYGGSILIRSKEKGRPLTLMVTPFIDSYGTSGLFERMAMIFIAEPDGDAGLIETDLSQVYGLTRAEARLALLLAQGHSITEIAKILAITPNTARTHLKRIFGKTDTNRQGALVKLILSNHRPAQS